MMKMFTRNFQEMWKIKTSKLFFKKIEIGEIVITAH